MIVVGWVVFWLVCACLFAAAIWTLWENALPPAARITDNWNYQGDDDGEAEDNVRGADAASGDGCR